MAQIQRYYILNEAGEVEGTDDVMAWAAWFERAGRDGSRIIAQDKDERNEGVEILISTVFLGLNHDLLGAGPPLLWETMIFGGLLDGEQTRYRTRGAALAGHAEACRRVRESLKE